MKAIKSLINVRATYRNIAAAIRQLRRAAKAERKLSALEIKIALTENDPSKVVVAG
jgi:hypothetical protein